MFENTKKCINKIEDIINRDDTTSEEDNFVIYFELHLAEALMKDLDTNSEKVAKIILAYKGLSNEIKVKVE